MASSAVNSIIDRNIEQLLDFVYQTTAEVASFKNKLDHQEELVGAFDGDATATGFVAANTKQGRQDRGAAYRRKSSPGSCL